MKKLLLALCLVGFSYATQAQTTTPPVTPTSEKKKKPNLAKELNLNEAQKKTMANMRKSGKAQVDSIKNNTTLTEAQKKTELKKVKQEERKKVEGILTTEQKAKLAELQPKKKGKKTK
jgi:Spy/CpxP family protein refolding chaperone